MYMNKVILAGFTGRDAKTGATQAGKQITGFSVATTKGTQGRRAEVQEKTQWHTCVAYGPLAEYAAKLQTGAHVQRGRCVSGPPLLNRPLTTSFTTKQEYRYQRHRSSGT